MNDADVIVVVGVADFVGVFAVEVNDDIVVIVVAALLLVFLLLE